MFLWIHGWILDSLEQDGFLSVVKNKNGSMQIVLFSWASMFNVDRYINRVCILKGVKYQDFCNLSFFFKCRNTEKDDKIDSEGWWGFFAQKWPDHQWKNSLLATICSL